MAEKPENERLLREVLAEVTGHRLALEFTIGEETGGDQEEEKPASEAEFVSLFKSTFDAREVDEPPS